MKHLLFTSLGLLLMWGCSTDSIKTECYEPKNENKAFYAISWERGEVLEVVTIAENEEPTKAVIRYSFAVEESPLKWLTDSLTCSFLSECEQSLHVNREFFEKEAKAFVNEFKAFESEGPTYLFPWYLDAEVDYCSVDSIYVKGEFMMESYMGGAHGSHTIMYKMINAKTNKIVQLSDLFANRKELDKRAELIFRKQYEIDARANLVEEGFWFENGTFTVNENFYFDQNDIVFHFNPYEIGPYAMGSFTIQIPLSNLKDLMRQ